MSVILSTGSSLKEKRDFVNRTDERLDRDYDGEKHYGIDYILDLLCMQCVWSPIVDQGFGNIKGVSVVR